MAGYPDDVPPFNELIEELKLLLSEIVLPDIQLDLSRFITKIGKDCFPVVPDDKNSPRRRDLFRTLVVGYIRVGCFDIKNCVLPVKR